MAAFNDWYRSKKDQAWMQRTFDELRAIIQTVRPPLPESLKGIGEDSDEASWNARLFSYECLAGIYFRSAKKTTMVDVWFMCRLSCSP